MFPHTRLFYLGFQPDYVFGLTEEKCRSFSSKRQSARAEKKLRSAEPQKVRIVE
jgi:hypothetical protein